MRWVILNELSKYYPPKENLLLSFLWSPEELTFAYESVWNGGNKNKMLFNGE